MELNELFSMAKTAAGSAYAPYSGCHVGAALLGESGSVYTGCNVESGSYSLTICAERNAIFQAVSAGEKRFSAIAIWVDQPRSFPPCGACRQVMAEFPGEWKIIYGNDRETIVTSLDELLPHTFRLT